MYIDNNEKLTELCQEIKTAKLIGFDTEFMREKTFFPILCLIQLNVNGKACAIDPLKTDVKPLLEILVKAPMLIFHSGRQDLEIIFNLIGKLPKNIFDTQIAAMVCGFGEQVSYQMLVQNLLGKRVDKTERYTDWAARPLSAAQVEYALSDVIHLPEIYAKLSESLKKQNREKWFENDEASLKDIKYFEANESDAWQKIKHREKKNCHLGVLKELASWRELKARRVDRPRKRVLSDDAVIEIALRKPKTKEELTRMRSFGHHREETIKEILLVVQKGLGMADESIPKLKPRPKKEADAGTVELLKIILKTQCNKNDVAQKLVATTEEIEQFVLGEKPDFLNGWKYDVFGKYAEDLLAGKTKLFVENGRMKIA
jgi:ribonuclease D